MINLRNFSFFVGNLGRDPELRYTPKGTAVANFSIALNERRKIDGEIVKETTWVDLVAYGIQADLIMKLLKKGAMVAVIAKYEKRPYETAEGEKRTFHGHTLQFFDVLKFAGDAAPDTGDEGNEGSGGSEEDEDQFPF